VKVKIIEIIIITFIIIAKVIKIFQSAKYICAYRKKTRPLPGGVVPGSGRV
jgi:hypothetical protein